MHFRNLPAPQVGSTVFVGDVAYIVLSVHRITKRITVRPRTAADVTK